MYLLLVEKIDQLVSRQNNPSNWPHQTMSKEDEIVFLRPLFDGLFDYNDQTYTYHLLNELPSGRYVYLSLFWIKTAENYFRIHCHVDAVMQWHNNINMIVLFTTMNMTYKYFTQRIVESMIVYVIEREYPQNKLTSLIWPIRSNQTIGRSSKIGTMDFIIDTRLRFEEDDLKNITFIPFVSTVASYVQIVQFVASKTGSFGTTLLYLYIDIYEN